MADTKTGLKERIRAYWDASPCGTLGDVPQDPDRAYFEGVRERRYRLEPWSDRGISGETIRGKRVLEIGCGLGTDGGELVRRGATYTAIDASGESLELARRFFSLEGFAGTFVQADAERLPFPDASFEFVYSWGVLHHTPDIRKAIAEVQRVLVPNGSFCIMLYNRCSLVGFQLWALHGLLRGKPFVSWRTLFAEHHESPGTQAFTRHEMRELFHDFSSAKLCTVVTPYDARVAHRRFLPKPLRVLIPRSLGFFHVMSGTK